MKKLLLVIGLAAATISVKAQALSQLFYYEATTTATELLTTTSVSYSLAYNKSTGKLYVANRGDQIYILNPDSYTGTISSIDKTTLPTLNKGSINQQYSFSKVRVDDDGVIYATAMQTNGTIYIYRWADETATPTVKFFTTADEPSLVGRVGDSFGLFGTGDNTYLYVAGNAVGGGSKGDQIYIFNVLSGVPTYAGTVDISAARHNATFTDVAKGSISPEANNILWLGTTDGGVSFRRLKIDLTTMQYVSHQVISSSNANFNSTVGEFVNENGQGYFLAASGRSTANQNLVQLTKTGTVGDATPTLQNVSNYTFGKTSYTTNSGYADVAFKRNADNTTTFFVLTSQNYLGAVKTDVALPVSLTSFDAALLKGESTLSWSTASERDNKGFEVLRSTDGATFTSIDFVAAKSTSGNSVIATNYTYVDRSAKAGVNYYQLRQVDLDGKSELFDKVVSVNVKLSNAGVTVYPNPAAAYVNVSTGGADFKGYQYDLFDVNGKKVLSAKATSGEQQISLSGLAPSIYYLRVSKDNVSQNTIKLIKK